MAWFQSRALVPGGLSQWFERHFHDGPWSVVDTRLESIAEG